MEKMGIKDRRRKGDRTRRWVKKWYEKHGYRVYVVPEARWSEDIFGFGDLLAVNNQRSILVQVKSSYGGWSWGRMEKLADNIPDGIDKEFWLGKKRRFEWDRGKGKFVELEGGG